MAQAKKTTAKKAAPRKAPARKAAAKKVAAKQAADTNFRGKTQENVRNVFLAGLGLYGRAFEEAQNQLKEARSQMKENRGKANELFEELVARGEKVEARAKARIEDLELPEIKLSEFKLADNDELQARLDKARDSFNTLKEAVAFKSTTA